MSNLKGVNSGDSENQKMALNDAKCTQSEDTFTITSFNRRHIMKIVGVLNLANSQPKEKVLLRTFTFNLGSEANPSQDLNLNLTVTVQVYFLREPKELDEPNCCFEFLILIEDDTQSDFEPVLKLSYLKADPPLDEHSITLAVTNNPSEKVGKGELMLTPAEMKEFFSKDTLKLVCDVMMPHYNVIKPKEQVQLKHLKTQLEEYKNLAEQISNDVKIRMSKMEKSIVENKNHADQNSNQIKAIDKKVKATDEELHQNIIDNSKLDKSLSATNNLFGQYSKRLKMLEESFPNVSKKAELNTNRITRLEENAKTAKAQAEKTRYFGSPL